MDTPQRLRYAIVSGKLSTVRQILEWFPHLLENVDPASGWSNLHHAAFNGQYAICVELVTRGHDKNEVRATQDGDTALHLAAKANQERCLHYLAQHIQRSIDWRNLRGQTALMAATEQGNEPCVALLLDFGADMDKGDLRDSRPLHIAAAYGHVKVLRTLVDRGANAVTANADGWTPIDFSFSVKVQQYFQVIVPELARQKLSVAHNKPSIAPVSRAAHLG